MTSPVAPRLICSFIALFFCVGQAGSAGQAVRAPLTPSIQRFLSRSDEPLRSYRALRHLEGHNKRYNKHGWIDAWTSLDPEKGFSFEIVGQGGSGYVRDKVLRKALERERDAHLQRETRSAALEPANYEFSDEGPALDGIVGVRMKPRRNDALLVSGTVYLTADAGDLVRVEGELVKRPSFWTRKVQIVRRYGRLSDVRVPMTLESTAQIVLAGESSFSMIYDYASINGREVGKPQPRGSSMASGRPDDR